MKAFSEEKPAVVHINIDFVENLFLDKYDVDVFFDGIKIQTLAHGKDYQDDISTVTGQHTLVFSNIKKPEVQWIGTFSASEETTISISFLTHYKEIEVREYTSFDDAAYKAEEKKKAELKEAQLEEVRKKQQFDRDVNALRNLSDPEDLIVEQFVEKYKDQTIKLEGNIPAVVNIDGENKYLFRLGDYTHYSDKGADFVIDLAKIDLNSTGNIGKGSNITFLGKIQKYDNQTHRIIIEPDSLTKRYETHLKPLDTSSPGLIMAVQDALNKAGYACGKPDGVAGKKTYAAISQFKRDNGLIEEAAFGTALLAMLRVAEPKEETKAVVNDQSVAENPNTSNRAAQQKEPVSSYVLNKNTKKFHYSGCSSVRRMKESNKVYYSGTRSELIKRGYSPCGRCNP